MAGKEITEKRMLQILLQLPKEFTEFQLRVEHAAAYTQGRASWKALQRVTLSSIPPSQECCQH